jgi:hypothetical protein
MVNDDNTTDVGGRRYGKMQRQIEILMETCQKNPKAKIAMVRNTPLECAHPELLKAMLYISKEYPEVTFNICIIDPSAKGVGGLECEEWKDEHDT